MSFVYSREVLPPTATHAALWCSLLPAEAPDGDDAMLGGRGRDVRQLVLARHTEVDVYRLAPVLACDGEDGAVSSTARLQLVCTARFAEPVASLAAVRLSGRAARDVTGADDVHALLVSFAPGRVSALVLDVATLSFRTVCMLNFEEGALSVGSSVRAKRRYSSYSGLAGLGEMVVDPDQRAAAMLVYDEQIAIIPFKRHVLAGLLDDDDDMDAAAAAAAPRGAARSDADLAPDMAASAAAVDDMDAATARLLGTPFILDTTSVASIQPLPMSGTVLDAAVMDGAKPPVLGTIRALAWLAGSALHPMLAILHEPVPTSTSRLASLAHTCTLTVCTVHTESGTASVQWAYDRLPHDSFALTAMPLPHAGVLVWSPSAVLYATQSAMHVLVCNDYAALTLDARATYRMHSAQRGSAVSLSCARAACVSPTHVHVALPDGAVFILTLVAQGGGGSGVARVTALTLQPALVSLPFPSALALLHAPHAVSTALNSRPRDQEVHAGLLAAACADADAYVCAYTLTASLLAESSGMAASTGANRSSALVDDVVMDDEDAALYAPVAPQRAASTPASSANDAPEEGCRYDVLAVDSLPCFARIRDACAASDANFSTDSHTPAGSCLAITLNATIAMCSSVMRPVVITSVQLQARPAGAWCASINKADVEALLLVGLATGGTRAFTSSAAGVEENTESGLEMAATVHTLAVGVCGAAGTRVYTYDDTAARTDAVSVCDGTCTRVAQVHSQGVRVCDAVPPFPASQDIPAQMELEYGGAGVPAGGFLVAAAVCDPYIVMRVSDGSVRIAMCDVHGDMHVDAPALDGGNVTAVCVYDDSVTHSLARGVGCDDATTHFMCTVTREGVFRLYTLPTCTLVFTTPDVHTGPRTLVHTRLDPAVTRAPSRTYVCECVLHGCDADNSLVLLLANSDGDVFVYNLIPRQGAIATRFLRETGGVRLLTRGHGHILDGLCAHSGGAHVHSSTCIHAPLFTPFQCINGWTGVFTATPTPVFMLFVRGRVVAVTAGVPDVTSGAVPGDVICDMHTPGDAIARVTAFTPFHASACAHGCVWAHSGDCVQFATLPPPQWPVAPRHVVMSADVLPHMRPRRYLHGRMCTAAAAPLGVAAGLLVLATANDLEMTEADVAALCADVCVPEDDGVYTRVDVMPGVAARRYTVSGTVYAATALSMTSMSEGAAAVRAAGVDAGSRVYSTGLMAVAFAPVRRLRDHAADIVAETAELTSKGGEHVQFDVGPHLELIESSTTTYTGATSSPLDTDVCIRLYAVSHVDDPTGAWTHHDTLTLSRHERVRVMTEVPASHMGGAHALCVGTAITSPRGEDAHAQGRIIILRVVQGAGDGDAPTFKWTRIYAVTMRSPVMAFTHMVAKGTPYILMAEGRTVHVCLWKAGQASGPGVKPLDGSAIAATGEGSLSDEAVYRTETLVKSVSAITDLVCACDLYGSVRFLRMRPEDRTLQELAVDDTRMRATALQFFRQEASLGIVVCDDECNVFVSTYAPKERTDERLQPRADTRTHTHAVRMLRDRCAFAHKVPPAARLLSSVTICGAEGSVRMLTPVDEITFKRLRALAHILTYSMPHDGGLNPISSRLTQLSQAPTHAHMRNVVDAHLLSMYVGLPSRVQRDIARSMGSTHARIMDTLRQLQVAQCTW